MLAKKTAGIRFDIKWQGRKGKEFWEGVVLWMDFPGKACNLGKYM